MIQKARILVIHEDPIIGSSVKSALEESRHTVIVVQSAAAAMEALREIFDIVFIHQGLPDSPSDEIIRCARTHSGTSIILISSERTDQAKKTKLRPGADEILCNPLDIEPLCAAAQRCLNSEKDPLVVPDSPRILVVDDDDIVLRGVIDTLEGRFEVTGTKSPEKALRIIEDSPCEILLTDLMMEEMHGLELIKAARNIRPSLVAIVMTGYASKETAVGALNEGAHDFLEKPFTPDVITQTVIRAWKGLRIKLLNNRLLAELRQTNEELRSEVEMRKRTENALRKSEERYYRLFEESPVALCELDASKVKSHIESLQERGVKDFDEFFQENPKEMLRCINTLKIRNINRSALNLFGVESKNELMENLSALFVKEYLSNLIGVFCATARSNRMFEVEWSARKLSGEMLKLIMQSSVAPGFEDTWASVMVSFMDLTLQKKIDKALQDERNFISAVLDNAGAIILVMNQEGRILRCNKACKNITGYTSKELAGRFIRDFLITSQEDDAAIQTSGHGGRGHFPLSEGNCWVTRDGRHKVISWSNTILKNESEPGRQVSIGIDITEKRKAEEEARLHRRQLYQADKMATLGILVSGVAHEINNPNNFITMNGIILHEIWESVTPILEKHYEENGDFQLSRTSYSKMREHIPKLFYGINDGAERIKTIVNNLKDYAREGSSDMGENVEINNAIKAVVTLLANQIKKSTNFFTVTYCDNPPNVKGNFQRIEQVLINLVQNACQALPDMKKGIEITAFHDEINGRVVVRIKDEGIGIPKEHIDHIFDPFFTTKRDTRGTGLGLSISAGIVKEHDGKLEFISKEGKGTTASLILQASSSTRS